MLAAQRQEAGLRARDQLAAAASPALAGQALCWSVGGRCVVDGVGLEVRPGEAVALLGPNGAGKTSLLRVLAGVTRAAAGRVLLAGVDVTALPLHRRAQLGLGYLPQEPSVFSGLSVRENLEAALARRPRAQRGEQAQRLLALFELDALAQQRAGTVSGGERRRLELARLLAIEPAVVLLDEPFAGLDPLAVAALSRHIERLLRDGVALLLADHCVDHALAICHRACVLAGGRVIATGSAEEVRVDDVARRAFFGSTAAKPGE